MRNMSVFCSHLIKDVYNITQSMYIFTRSIRQHGTFTDIRTYVVRSIGMVIYTVQYIYVVDTTAYAKP